MNSLRCFIQFVGEVLHTTFNHPYIPNANYWKACINNSLIGALSALGTAMLPFPSVWYHSSLIRSISHSSVEIKSKKYAWGEGGLILMSACRLREVIGLIVPILWSGFLRHGIYDWGLGGEICLRGSELYVCTCLSVRAESDRFFDTEIHHLFLDSRSKNTTIKISKG